MIVADFRGYKKLGARYLFPAPFSFAKLAVTCLVIPNSSFLIALLTFLCKNVVFVGEFAIFGHWAN